MATFPQWEYDLLKALSAPTSQSNLTALNLWAQSEGNVINNPLATSGRGAGATSCVAQCGTSSPIYEYGTEAEGVAQMAGFMGGSNSAGIVHALQQDAGLAGIWQAINSSKWCSGCQNGQYPTALFAALPPGSKPSTSPSVGTGPGSKPNPGQPAGTTPGSDLSTCVLQLPGFLFFSGPCLLTKGGVKWISGVAALAFGAGVFAFGVVMIAGFAYNVSGAKEAVGGTARKIGVGGALLTGQPEVAAGIAATSRSSSRRSSSPGRFALPSGRARTVGLGPGATGRPGARSQRATEELLEQFKSDRAASSETAAQRRRRAQQASTRSVPGSGRRPSAEQRRRRAARAARPGSPYGTPSSVRAQRRAEGFERV